jgi:hypothetical protein
VSSWNFRIFAIGLYDAITWIEKGFCRMMKRILANDGLDPSGLKMLQQAGFEVDTTPVPQEELPTVLPVYDALIVRSATQVRKPLIDAYPVFDPIPSFVQQGNAGKRGTVVCCP